MARDTSSFSIHGLSKDEAYRHLDTEIAYLQDRLCSLRTLRNSIAPISKIPTELLSKVFLHSQGDNPSGFLEERNINTRFFLSWVCRHWRDTALATPNLWRAIHKESMDVSLQLDFAQGLLSRSRNADLTINLASPTEEILQLCGSEIPRMKHLRLVRPPSGPELDSLFGQPAPLLASLELSTMSPPAAPFLRTYPQLRQLTISNCTTSPFSLFPSTLTKLHLQDLHPLLSARDLVVSLASLPHIADILLVSSLQTGIITGPASHRLTLPSLQVLSISDPFTEAIFAFLARLNIPQTQISIIWPEHEELTRELVTELSVELDHYWVQSLLPIQILDIQEDNEEHILISISTSPLHHRHTLEFPNKLGVEDETLNDALSALSLNNLQVLSTNLLTDRLLDKVESLGGLRRVTLSGNHTLYKFMLAFDVNAGGNTALTFPALEELTLSEIYEETTAAITAVSLFCSALSTRHLLGYVLDRLVLKRCPDLDRARFEQFVNDLSVVD